MPTCTEIFSPIGQRFTGALSHTYYGCQWCVWRKSVKKKLSPFLSPGWKFFIRQLWSDDRFYCSFLRRIRLWSFQAHRDTPCGVKLAFLGRKPQISGVKNQFFCVFHPGNIPDRQFDPGIWSGIKNYIRKVGQIISVALFSQFSPHIWRQGPWCGIPFN